MTGSSIPVEEEVRTAILRGLLEEGEGLTSTTIYDSLYGDERDEFRNARVVDRALRSQPEVFHAIDGRWYLGPAPSREDELTSSQRPPSRSEQPPPVARSPRTAAPDQDRLPWDPTDIVATERRLRDQLRGRRLIAECGLDARSHEEYTDLVEDYLRRGTQAELARTYPHLFLVFLVGHAVYRYDGGLWHSMSVRGIDSTAGPIFEKTCVSLGFEDFSALVHSEGAMRYVAPIVAHGGIPKYSLNDFFDLVVRGIGRVGPDVDALLSYWRTRRSAFANIDRPVGRFLLYGGDLAADILDRCIDAITAYQETGTLPSAAEIALPNYLLVGLARYGVPRFPTTIGSTGTRRGGLRPEVVLDPWTPLGPELHLPAVPAALADPGWRVVAAGRIDAVPASTFEERRVGLTPARTWSLELTDCGVTTQEWDFEAFDSGPALFFDPRSGVAASAARSLLGPSVWALAPADAHFLDRATQQPVREIESLPGLIGEWSGFAIRHLDLDGVTSLKVEADKREVILRVRTRASQPELLVPSVADVVTVDGRPVFAAPPQLQLPRIEGIAPADWRIRCLVGTESVETHVDDELVASIGLPQDAPLLPDVLLTARGPLGADFKLRFAVARGLTAQVPQRLVLPGDRHAPARVHAPELALNGGPTGNRHELATDQIDTSVSISDGQRELDVRLLVPRLVWSVVRSGGSVSLDTEVDVVEGEDLASGLAQALLVQTGAHGVDLELVLLGDGKVLQRSDRAKSGHGDGRWMFDLADFRDTVQAATNARLEFQLDVGVRPVSVVHLRPSVAIERIEPPVCRLIGDQAHVTVVFRPARTVQGRVLRLWSLDRPWVEPIAEAIDDDAEMVQVLRSRDELPPGRYLAEIDVEDGWTTPCRPNSGPTNVAVVQLGSNDERNVHLESLAGGDALGVLERALSLGHISRRLTTAELGTVAPAALTALRLFEVDRDAGMRTPRGLAAAATLLCGDDEVLTRTLVAHAEARSFDRRVSTLLAVRLMRRLHGTAPGAVDDEDLRRLWATAPSIAVALDAVACPSPERSARLEASLEWNPEGELTDLPTGDPVQQQVAGLPAGTLRSIRSQMDLFPKAILDIDSLAAANFEWLIAVADGDFDVQDFCRRHRSCLGPNGDQPAEAARHLEHRTAPKGTVAWASFPSHTLSAALAVTAPGRSDNAREDLLIEAAQHAPRLVERDLVLARLLHVYSKPSTVASESP